MVEAVVEFDYAAQEVDELTLRKGDKIVEVVTLPGGWWEGTLSGKRGMFPDNFVKIVSKPDNSIKSLSHNDVPLRTKGGRRCKVLYSYQPANEDELQLTVNDIIDVISEVEDGWWRGSLREMVGVFPSNFVAEIFGEEARRPRPGSRDDQNKIPDSESDGDRSTSVSSPDSSQLMDTSVGAADAGVAHVPNLPPKPVKEQCRALFAYEAANADELTLKEGDVVTLISREVQDKGWWRGELAGRVGLFPDNFVELLPPECPEQADAAAPPRKPERLASGATKAPLATTNRARDTISKPAAKSELPPVPGKKPPVPLASKKPVDQPDGAGPSRMSRSCDPPPPPSTDPPEVTDFDSVERSAMLTHPTASRAKAPGRRPPSAQNSKDGDPPNLTNGSDPHEEPAAAKKLWEKNKVPWMDELKLNQQKKTVNEPPKTVSAVRSNSRPQSMYGDLSNMKGRVSPPSKLSRPVPMAKTTVEIGKSEPNLKDSLSGEVKRESVSPVRALQAKKEPISPLSTTKKEPLSSVGSSLSSRKEVVSPLSGSLLGGRKDVVSPLAKSHVPKPEGKANGRDVESVGDLKAMIAELHASLERQRETFTRALHELTDKLNDETHKRMQLEQQIVKLTDLVTQV